MPYRSLLRIAALVLALAGAALAGAATAHAQTADAQATDAQASNTEAPNTQADDPQALAAKGAELLKAGQPADAYKAFNSAAIAAWLQSPLGFHRALLVADAAKSYGAFTERENDVFDGKTPLRFYAEPTGFGWTKTADIYSIDLTIDFSLKAASGQDLGSQKDFQTFKIEGRDRVREMFMNLTLTLNDAPDGAYIATFTVNDKATGKSGSFDVPFEIKHS
jgi:hypothetical protein